MREAVARDIGPTLIDPLAVPCNALTAKLMRRAGCPPLIVESALSPWDDRFPIPEWPRELAEGSVTPRAICGPPGRGKTKAAAEVMIRWLSLNPEGDALWLDASRFEAQVMAQRKTEGHSKLELGVRKREMVVVDDIAQELFLARTFASRTGMQETDRWVRRIQMWDSFVDHWLTHKVPFLLVSNLLPSMWGSRRMESRMKPRGMVVIRDDNVQPDYREFQ